MSAPKVTVLRTQLISILQICLREITRADEIKCLEAARKRVDDMERLAARWPDTSQ